MRSGRRSAASRRRSRSAATAVSRQGADRLVRSAISIMRDALIAEARRPVERNPFARPFLQRRAIGRDRLLEPRRPALPLAERQERIAEIVLRRRPMERDPLARPFLQRRAKGLDRLLKPRRPALPLAERLKRIAEIVLRHRPSSGTRSRVIPPAPRDRPRPPPRTAPSRSPARRASQAQCQIVLRHRPVERHSLARPFLKRRAIGRNRLLEPRCPALPLAEPVSALPRLFCVVAQSSGTRSRVSSSSACAKAATASSSRTVPLSRSPSLQSALPRCPASPPSRAEPIAR